jgi:hypothetical protein
MDFSEIVFNVFNGWHMALGSLLIALILMWRSYNSTYKALNMKIKSLNWLLMAVAFLLTEVLDMPSITERMWLRTAFALLLIGELAYHGDCIFDIWERGYHRIRPDVHNGK